MHVFPHGSTVQWFIRQEFRSEPSSPRKKLLPSMKYEPDSSMATLRWYCTWSTRPQLFKTAGPTSSRARTNAPRQHCPGPLHQDCCRGQEPNSLLFIAPSIQHGVQIDARRPRVKRSWAMTSLKASTDLLKINVLMQSSVNTREHSNVRVANGPKSGKATRTG